MTAGERMVSLSGLSSGTAAAHFLAIETGGGGTLPSDRIGMLSDVWRRFGLDPAAPLTETDTAAIFGGITITKAGAGPVVSTRSGSDAHGTVELMIRDLWQRLGLDPDNPMTAAADAIAAGFVTQSIVPTAGGVIVTRAEQPYLEPGYVAPGYLENQQ